MEDRVQAAGKMEGPRKWARQKTMEEEKALRRASIIEVEKRKELAQLQNQHVAALKSEIEQLREENAMLVAALGTNDTAIEFAGQHVATTEVQARFLVTDNDRLRQEHEQLRSRISELQQEIEVARATTQMEIQKREASEIKLADTVQKLNMCIVDHGAEDLAARYAMSSKQKPLNSDSNEKDNWESLLEDTAAFQSECRSHDVSRAEQLATFRTRAVASNKNFEDVREYLNMLDLMQPKPVDLVTQNVLDRLLDTERRLHEMKSTRRQLEEHLSYLNRVQADHKDTEPHQQPSYALLSSRVWELEHTNQEIKQSNAQLTKQCRLHLEHKRELTNIIERGKYPDSRASSYTDLTSSQYLSDSTHSVFDARSYTMDNRSGADVDDLAIHYERTKPNQQMKTSPTTRI